MDAMARRLVWIGIRRLDASKVSNWTVRFAPPVELGGETSTTRPSTLDRMGMTSASLAGTSCITVAEMRCPGFSLRVFRVEFRATGNTVPAGMESCADSVTQEARQANNKRRFTGVHPFWLRGRTRSGSQPCSRIAARLPPQGQMYHGQSPIAKHPLF